MDTGNTHTHHAEHEYPQLTGHTDDTTLAFIDISDTYGLPMGMVLKLWACMGRPRNIDTVRQEVERLFYEFGTEELLYGLALAWVD